MSQKRYANRFSRKNRVMDNTVRAVERLEDRRLLTTTLFFDGFESGALSVSLWPSSSPAQERATVIREGDWPLPSNVPGTYSAAIYGTEGVSSRGMQSKAIDLSGYQWGSLSFDVLAEGEGDSPESDEDLIVEYRNTAGSWKRLHAIDQASVSHSTFESTTGTLPQDAFHNEFAFRIYAMGLNYTHICSFCITAPADHWFVDSVRLRGSRPPHTTWITPATGTDANEHTLSWAVSDPDDDAITSVTSVLLRDNVEIDGPSSAVSGSFAVTQEDGPGTYTLKVIATDATGATAIRTSSPLVVTDDDDEGPSISVTGPSGPFAADDQTFSWSITDFSGSTSDVVLTKNGQEIFSRHYTSNVTSDTFDFNDYGVGSFTLSIIATDEDTDRSHDQETSSHVVHANITNASPEAVLNIRTPTTDIFEGSEVAFDARLSFDPEGDPIQHIWDFGDGSLSLGDTPTHMYREDGQYPVLLTVVDSYGNTSSATESVTVRNAAPVLTASSSTSVSEASAFNLNLAAFDPGEDTASFFVDWGDGSTDSYSSAGNKQHVYAHGGLHHPLRVSLFDEDGTYPDQYVATVTVNDAPPILDGFPGFVSAQPGQPVQWNLDIVDGAHDTHVFHWDFGDEMSASGPDLNGTVVTGRARNLSIDSRADF